eukprot:1156201-Pelagomonas_calceolata.AAC.7
MARTCPQLMARSWQGRVHSSWLGHGTLSKTRPQLPKAACKVVALKDTCTAPQGCMQLQGFPSPTHSRASAFMPPSFGAAPTVCLPSPSL